MVLGGGPSIRKRSGMQHRDPRVLTSWLCLSCWRDSRPFTLEGWGGGVGTDEISTSHLLLPITIIIKLLTPHSLCLFFFFLSPSHSPRCLVTLAPCYLAPPILPPRQWRRGKREADREREREAAAHYHRVPRGPSACLPLLSATAPPAAQYEPWLSTGTPHPRRAAGIFTVPRPV